MAGENGSKANGQKKAARTAEEDSPGIVGMGSVIAVGVYILCSSAMLIVNKQAVKALPHPFVVSAMQLFASALFAVMLRGLGQVSFPNPTVSKMWGWKGILLAWVVPILLNMKAMRLVSVETMMMFRSVATVAVAAGDTLLLGTELSPRKLFSCVVISLGGLIYAQNDLQFDLAGYIWGGCYALSMVVNTVYIKHSFNQLKDMGAWEKTFLNNLLATPLVLSLAYGNEGLEMVAQRLVTMEIGGATVVLLSCVMGLGISLSGTKCRDVLTATSFDVLGNCTKYLTLGMSYLLGSSTSAGSYIGVLIALTGCALYSPAGELLLKGVGAVTGVGKNKTA